MKFKRPRGTSDIFGERVELWRRVEQILADTIMSYGYSEIRTPVFESTNLFSRAVGEGTDIVTKEMYTFTDKKGRSLTLRPENTAPVMRAYLENGLHRRGGLARFFYIGPMFRYDRPQAGRYRQFHQVGAEALGSPNPSVDAEIIDISVSIYRAFGYPELEVKLNSVGCPRCRHRFKEVLRESLSMELENLCDNCSSRIEVNPMRIFDCKECYDIKKRLPTIIDYICVECNEHFDKLKEILESIGIGYSLDPLLVRGLDYYTKTAYEIVHPDLGAQNALCGGGRYDGLAEDCGGPAVPGVGFSAGIERLIETLPGDFTPETVRDGTRIYFVVLEEAGHARAMAIARKLRRECKVEVDLTGRGIKRQMRAAAASGARLAVIVGAEELQKGEATVKELDSGRQEAVPFDELPDYATAERE